MITGWTLPAKERLKLLTVIAPIYRDRFPQGIVHQMRGTDEAPSATSGSVVGRFDDGEGQQVLILEIDGTTIRPDGRTLYIPWSRDAALMGRKPYSSEHPLLVAEWQKLDQPILVELTPTVFKLR